MEVDDERVFSTPSKSNFIIGNRCIHMEGAMVSGRGPHICKVCQITVLKERVKELEDLNNILLDKVSK